MAGESPPSDPAVEERSPAGAPAEQKAVDQRWRLWASVLVVLALAVGGLIGLVIIPAGQRDQSHLSMKHAMRRAAGLEPGSPAVAQPLARSTSLPVSQVSWDPQIMSILTAGNSRRGGQLAAQTCAPAMGTRACPRPTFRALPASRPTRFTSSSTTIAQAPVRIRR